MKARLQRLQRWGNSNAIRIPKVISNSMDISENDTLELVVVDGVLTAKKVVSTMPGSLAQLYEEFYGMSIDEILNSNVIEHEQTEVLWGKPVGGEEW